MNLRESCISLVYSKIWQIFFIINHLLHAVACVAVSNFLEFLHKIKPSSCLAAMPSKARFIRRISAVSNAIETIDNEMICFITYCLNCIRHGRNATYERGLS